MVRLIDRPEVSRCFAPSVAQDFRQEKATATNVVLS